MKNKPNWPPKGHPLDQSAAESRAINAKLRKVVEEHGILKAVVEHFIKSYAKALKETRRETGWFKLE